MKSRIFSFFAALALMCMFTVTTAGQVQAQSTGDLAHAEGVGRSALASCVANLNSNLEIGWQTTLTGGECGSGGYYRVSVYGAPRCMPGEICPLFIFLIATADVDCDFNLISVNCGF